VADPVDHAVFILGYEQRPGTVHGQSGDPAEVGSAFVQEEADQEIAVRRGLTDEPRHRPAPGVDRSPAGGDRSTATANGPLRNRA
jgi:hypothetical protein